MATRRSSAVTLVIVVLRSFPAPPSFVSRVAMFFHHLVSSSSGSGLTFQNFHDDPDGPTQRVERVQGNPKEKHKKLKLNQQAIKFGVG